MEKELDKLVGSRVTINCLYHSVSFCMIGKLISYSNYYRIIDDKLNFVSFCIEDVEYIVEDSIILK